jgi:hypothetical protein
MPFPWAPIIMGAAQLGSSFLSGKSAKSSISSQIMQNEWEAQQAQIQRDWQERMSNTAIQRQVKDATDAGINPYYLLQGGSSGSSTPSGAMATGSSPFNSQAAQMRMQSISYLADSASKVVEVMKAYQEYKKNKPKSESSEDTAYVVKNLAKDAKTLYNGVVSNANSVGGVATKVINSLWFEIMKQIEGVKKSYREGTLLPFQGVPNK